MPTVLCYGDSNTHGSPALADISVNARLVRPWPAVLAELSGWKVIAEGLPGRTTVHNDPVEGVHKNGLAHLPVSLESHRPLDVVAILLGTNDLKARFGVGPFEIAQSAARLVQAVSTSTAGRDGVRPKPLLIAPTPIIETGRFAELFAGGAEKSRRLAEEYAAQADLLSCAFLDAGQHMTVSPVDGIHFDQDQHDKLGRAVAAKLGEMTC